MSIETKNHARPSVRIANGNVSSLSSGLRIVFSTPKTSAAQMSVQPEPLTSTPLRIHAVIPSTTAFAAHETSIHLITPRMLLRKNRYGIVTPCRTTGPSV
jgi:hypothetical protein